MIKPTAYNVYDYRLDSPSIEGKKLQFEKRQSVIEKRQPRKLRVPSITL